MLVMLVGLAGTIIPVLPGLLLIWGAALGAWLIAGPGTVGWVSLVVISLLGILGTAAKLALPARSGRAGGVPTSTLVAGLAAAVVGFFVIPVVGFLLGGVAGLWLAEAARLGDQQAAGRSTASILRGYGIGIAIEIGAGVAMVAVFAVTAVLA